MKLTNSQLSENIWQLGQVFVSAYEKKYSHLPVLEKNDDWPSSCIKQDGPDNTSLWTPEKIDPELNFTNVESALTLQLHSSIKQYFTSMYSDAIPAHCEEGELFLLFPWSKMDFERLQENIIGHIMMKKKLKQEITIFFAVTDQDDFMLSIKNINGEVWLERVGCEPHKKIADSLLDFIASLTVSI